MKSKEELKVLVVDDSMTIRKIITTNLQKLGITNIFQAKNGEEGYTNAKLNKIDIILTDHNMAEMNGLAMVTKLRNDPKTEHIFVIAVSSEFDSTLKNEYGTLGVKNFIHKPFNQIEFNNAIKAYENASDSNGANWSKPTPTELKEFLKNGDFGVKCLTNEIEFDFGEQKLIVDIKDVAEKGRLYHMIELKD